MLCGNYCELYDICNFYVKVCYFGLVYEVFGITYISVCLDLRDVTAHFTNCFHI